MTHQEWKYINAWMKEQEEINKEIAAWMKWVEGRLEELDRRTAGLILCGLGPTTNEKPSLSLTLGPRSQETIDALKKILAAERP